MKLFLIIDSDFAKLYNTAESRQYLRRIGQYVISPLDASALNIIEKRVMAPLIRIYGDIEFLEITVYYTRIREEEVNTADIIDGIKKKLLQIT